MLGHTLSIHPAEYFDFAIPEHAAHILSGQWNFQTSYLYCRVTRITRLIVFVIQIWYIWHARSGGCIALSRADPAFPLIGIDAVIERCYFPISPGRIVLTFVAWPRISTVAVQSSAGMISFSRNVGTRHFARQIQLIVVNYHFGLFEARDSASCVPFVRVPLKARRFGASALIVIRPESQVT